MCIRNNYDYLIIEDIDENIIYNYFKKSGDNFFTTYIYI